MIRDVYVFAILSLLFNYEFLEFSFVKVFSLGSLIFV